MVNPSEGLGTAGGWRRLGEGGRRPAKDVGSWHPKEALSCRPRGPWQGSQQTEGEDEKVTSPDLLSGKSMDGTVLDRGDPQKACKT